MKVLGLGCLSPLAEAVADAAEDVHVGRLLSSEYQYN